MERVRERPAARVEAAYALPSTRIWRRFAAASRQSVHFSKKESSGFLPKAAALPRASSIASI
jgi:hypothetical protein